MRSWAILLLVPLPALAEPPGLGESLSAAEVAAVDFTVLPDGTGLPEGRGSVAEGEALYGQHCLACHGEGGEGGANDRLAGGVGSIGTDRPLKTVGSYWPYATTVFDYVRRAMPYNAPGTLASDEVYALTAYLLHLNGILDAEAVMDAGSLPAVSMPNREGFVWGIPAD
jgi:cytochrome c